MLTISQDLKLPADVVTQTLGVVAARGSGKTYLTAVLAEELIDAGLPVAVLDPVGVYYGLRSSADGKRPGLPVVILGGDHGDVPLEATAGKVIADWLVAERRPAVLDLSLMRKGDQRQFVTDFAEQLYRKNRDALHLILDEADLFAPQRPMPGEQRMLGAIEDLVRRGRARGLGLTLVTQRPAVIHKDVLTQVSALVAMRMMGPQDRAAVDAWIRFHGSEDDREEVLASLASLPVGTAWFWSPGWLGILKRVRIRQRRTFDSSSTPAVGTRKVEPQKLAPVDLEALRSRIASTIERAKQDDPRELRKRIAELERQVKAAPTKVERVEVPVLSEKVAEKLLAATEKLTAAAAAVGTIAADVGKAVAAARAAHGTAAAPAATQSAASLAREPRGRQESVAPAGRASEPNRVPPVRTAVRTGSNGSDTSAGDIPPRRRRILDAIATLAAHFENPPRELVAPLAGTGHWVSTFERDCGALRQSDGLIEYRVPGTMVLTEAGKLVAHAQPLDEAELHAAILARLEPRRARILRPLLERRGGPLPREELAQEAGTSASVSTFERDLGWMRSTGGLIDYPAAGQVAARAALFLE